MKLKIRYFDVKANPQICYADSITINSDSDWCVLQNDLGSQEMRISDIFQISCVESPIDAEQKATAQEG